MHATWPLLQATDFPALRRRALDTLQVNLGYRCNQSCQPLPCERRARSRTEMMDPATIDLVIEVLRAPKRSPPGSDRRRARAEPRRSVAWCAQARKLGVRVIDRCNLTILSPSPVRRTWPSSWPSRVWKVTASLPCYSLERVDRQRGEGVFDRSIAGLQAAQRPGLCDPNTQPPGAESGLQPPRPQPAAAAQGPWRPTTSASCSSTSGIRFNQLFALTNMPIQRFGSSLISKGPVPSLHAAAEEPAIRNPANLDTR